MRGRGGTRGGRGDKRGSHHGNRAKQTKGPSSKEDLLSLEKAVLKLDREKRKIHKLLQKLTALENEHQSGKKMEKNQLTLLEDGRKKRREHADRLVELDKARNGLILSTSFQVREQFNCCGNCGSISHKTKTCPRPQSLAMKNQRLVPVPQPTKSNTSTTKRSKQQQNSKNSKNNKNSKACETCGSTSHHTNSCPRPKVLLKSQKKQPKPKPTQPRSTNPRAPSSSLRPAIEKHILRPVGSNTIDPTLPRVLVIAEKPSVAKLIAQGLSNSGAMRTRHNPNGHAPMCKWHEIITFFPPTNSVASICITSVLGHLQSLDFVGYPDSSRPSLLFNTSVKKIIPVEMQDLGIAENIVDAAHGLVDPENPGREAPKATHLYLWLDCDREGENICMEIVNLLQERVGMFGSLQDVYRAKFSAVASSDVRRAWAKPSTIDLAQSNAVDVRQELDLKIGCAFTRLITKEILEMAKCKYEPSLGPLKVISYGPCQSPCLLFCVKRAKEIQQFVRRKYWSINCVGAFGNTHPAAAANAFVPLQWIPDKTFRKEEALNALAILKGTSFGTVIKYTQKVKVLRPPTALNTVELLRSCSVVLGLSPIKAMKHAEELYMSGYMSYPRTESTKYPQSLPVHDLVSPFALLQQSTHENIFRAAAEKILKGGGRGVPRRGKDAGDHPPITPLRCVSKKQVRSLGAWNVYRLVVQHFLASLLSELVYQEHTVIIECGCRNKKKNNNNKNDTKKRNTKKNAKNTKSTQNTKNTTSTSLTTRFKYCWNVVVDPGFCVAQPYRLDKLLFNPSPFKTSSSSKKISVGMKVLLSNFDMFEDETKPPSYLKEYELIDKMDKFGIGTDASMAGHCATIVQRKYVNVCDEDGTLIVEEEDGRRRKNNQQSQSSKRQSNSSGQSGFSSTCSKKSSKKVVQRHMVPTSLGMDFAEHFLMLMPCLVESKLRASMENEIAMIASGEEECYVVLDRNLKVFSALFDEYQKGLHKSLFLFTIEKKAESSKSHSLLEFLK